MGHLTRKDLASCILNMPEEYLNSYILLFLNYISILHFNPLFYLTMTVALPKLREILEQLLTVHFIVKCLAIKQNLIDQDIRTLIIVTK